MPKLSLDLDGSIKNIKAENYLATVDHLHDLISEEYFQSLKEPVLQHMRKVKEN